MLPLNEVLEDFLALFVLGESTFQHLLHLVFFFLVLLGVSSFGLGTSTLSGVVGLKEGDMENRVYT